MKECHQEWNTGSAPTKLDQTRLWKFPFRNRCLKYRKYIQLCVSENLAQNILNISRIVYAQQACQLVFTEHQYLLSSGHYWLCFLVGQYFPLKKHLELLLPLHLCLSTSHHSECFFLKFHIFKYSSLTKPRPTSPLPHQGFSNPSN